MSPRALLFLAALMAALPAGAAGGAPRHRAPPPRDTAASEPRVTLPVPLLRPPPVYPKAARRKGIEGTVLVEVLVGRDGLVEKARVVKSVRGLDKAALAAARRWVFDPARSGDKPVAARVTVPIEFKLDRER